MSTPGTTIAPAGRTSDVDSRFPAIVAGPPGRPAGPLDAADPPDRR
ncbi:hypothetical protein [Amycolatopsis sp. 195334CR]|nr:hypothetical protein [Amycolatopsis sp. 195334CR]MBN6042087.1 hypothetical protein [Amycolatopsis sp. 195334CR]